MTLQNFHWTTKLLNEPPTPMLRSSLASTIAEEARQFQAANPRRVPIEKNLELDKFYNSQEGQAILCAMFEEAWEILLRLSAKAMPSHDARHAIVKAPASAIELVLAGGITGHRRLGVLATFLHDWGRWAEERIYGHPANSVVHSRMSFLLVRDLLKKHPLPYFLQVQLLHAVLGHTTGAQPEDSDIIKLVVTADREQLVGPEAVLRFVHHPITEEASDSFIALDRTSVLGSLHRILANLLPGPMYFRQSEVARLWHTAIDFVLMCESEEASSCRFTRFPITTDPEDNPFIQREAWQSANVLNLGTKTELSLETAAREFLAAPHAATGEQFIAQALRRLDAIKCPEHRARVTRAFVWITAVRKQEDHQQQIRLKAAATRFQEDPLMEKMTSALLHIWS